MIDLNVLEKIATDASDTETGMKAFNEQATPTTVMKLIWVIRTLQRGLKESCLCGPDECDACSALEKARKILAEE